MLMIVTVCWTLLMRVRDYYAHDLCVTVCIHHASLEKPIKETSPSIAA